MSNLNDTISYFVKYKVYTIRLQIYRENTIKFMVKSQFLYLTLALSGDENNL